MNMMIEQVTNEQEWLGCDAFEDGLSKKIHSHMNGENDDETADLGVPYFDPNSVCVVAILKLKGMMWYFFVMIKLRRTALYSLLIYEI